MVQNNGSTVALSQRKTTVAILRNVLGPVHGQEAKFAKLAHRSVSWVKKLSAGPNKITEETARVLEHETGISFQWLLGPPNQMPVDSRGKRYTREDFEWFRARKKAGEPTIQVGFTLFEFVPDIVGIASAAGDQGMVYLFLWRLSHFIDQVRTEFGFSEKDSALAKEMLARSILRTIYIVDKGTESSLITSARAKKAISAAAKGRGLGEKFSAKFSDSSAQRGKKKKR